MARVNLSSSHHTGTKKIIKVRGQKKKRSPSKIKNEPDTFALLLFFSNFQERTKKQRTKQNQWEMFNQNIGL